MYAFASSVHPTRLVVVLVKPSKYDADGYLIQSWRGILPSNSVGVMYALTQAAFADPRLTTRGLACEVHAFDETVRAGRVDPQTIMARCRGARTVVVVGLVGVQTNQFPRARDLALAFQREGATVVMGGFHVSGSIAMMRDGERPDVPCPRVMPPECQELLDRGVVLFTGEAEHLWPQVLADIVSGKPQPLYRGGKPDDIASAPLPCYPARYFDGFFATLHTVDTGRGCPLKCSFCSIINVQGRVPRYRSAAAVVARVRALAKTEYEPFLFFVDDNFARNPLWEEILLGLEQLRSEGFRFSFMIEADLAAWKLVGKRSSRPFAQLLGAAGCVQVFMGVESMRQETLLEVHKGQNRVAEYGTMCAHYHRHGVTLHAGYIIGFPADTPETIRADIETLKACGFDRASFFILTPIPGSEDHARLVAAGTPLDADLNRYDSFQPVADHPRMTRDELQRAYDDAWRRFYTVDHMVAVLTRCRKEEYWSMLRTFLWYRAAALCERTHPMIVGLYRFRSYRDRRPGAPYISPARHVASELWRHLRYVGFTIAQFYVFEDVYFRTRWLPMLRAGADRQASWLRRTFGRTAHRGWLNAFWHRYAAQRWRLLAHPLGWTWHLRMLPHAAAEAVYTIRFALVVSRVLARTMIA